MQNDMKTYGTILLSARKSAISTKEKKKKLVIEVWEKCAWSISHKRDNRGQKMKVLKTLEKIEKTVIKIYSKNRKVAKNVFFCDAVPALNKQNVAVPFPVLKKRHLYSEACACSREKMGVRETDRHRNQ